jgi:hypothetical protein
MLAGLRTCQSGMAAVRQELRSSTTKATTSIQPSQITVAISHPLGIPVHTMDKDSTIIRNGLKSDGENCPRAVVARET